MVLLLFLFPVSASKTTLLYQLKQAASNSFSKKMADQVVTIQNQTISSSSNKCTVAVCQMTSTSDCQVNLTTCQDLITQAVEHGASMVFLPEACDFITQNRAEIPELSEPLTGKTISFMKSIAKTKSVWISVGGFHEKDLETNSIYVTHVIIDSLGKIQSVYRKSHLFSVDNKRKGGTSLRESDVVTPGNKIGPVVKTPVGLLGMQICYDLRFPEVSNVQTQQGAEILTFPSAFTLMTGMAHWSVLLRARAVENQCYVIAAAQTGYHSEKRASYGHAMVVDPWGNVLCDCGGEGTRIGLAVVDLDYLREVRARMPVWEHRRYDLYRNTKKDAEK